MREVVQRGLYYDELETGVVYRHRPGRTLTEADDVVFSTLTMNHQALHLDAAWAATQPFGQRLVNSMMTLSTLVGLGVEPVTLAVDATLCLQVFEDGVFARETVVVRPDGAEPLSRFGWGPLASS